MSKLGYDRPGRVEQGSKLKVSEVEILLCTRMVIQVLGRLFHNSA